jgi:hypothetical protein
VQRLRTIAAPSGAVKVERIACQATIEMSAFWQQ